MSHRRGQVWGEEALNRAFSWAGVEPAPPLLPPAHDPQGQDNCQGVKGQESRPFTFANHTNLRWWVSWTLLLDVRCSGGQAGNGMLIR